MTTPPFDPPTPGSGPPGPPGGSYPAFMPVAPEPDIAPVSAAPVQRSSAGSSRALGLALGLGVLVATGGVAFAVGRATAPATVGAAAVVGEDGTGGRGTGFPNGSFDPNGSGRTGGLTGRGGFGGLGALGGGLVIEGTVDSVSPGSVTIRMADGTTVTVGLDSSTTYHSAEAATASDVTAGETVTLQVTGGFRPGGDGGGTGANGAVTLGTAGDITIVP